MDARRIRTARWEIFGAGLRGPMAALLQFRLMLNKTVFGRNLRFQRWQRAQNMIHRTISIVSRYITNTEMSHTLKYRQL